MTNIDEQKPAKKSNEGQESGEFDAFAINRLSQAFESSAKRWELIVYPSLFAFIILAAYGFYLVFSLAKDIHYLAISVDTNMTILSSNMQSISDDLSQVSANVRTMAVSVESISGDIATLDPILTSMETMDKSIQAITFTTGTMRDEMAGMNHSIGRPMNFMNRFLPW